MKHSKQQEKLSNFSMLQRCKDVISSCNTFEQLNVAHTYMKVAYTKGGMSYKNYLLAYRHFTNKWDEIHATMEMAKQVI